MNLPSDLLCKPWYFDSTVGSNVSNNTDITVAPQDGNMVQVEDCFEIAALDGDIRPTTRSLRFARRRPNRSTPARRAHRKAARTLWHRLGAVPQRSSYPLASRR